MKNNVFQIMRGICIIAVVLTHVIDKSTTNSCYEVSLIIQNVVNCAVTGFIFLSGYFINIDEVATNTKHFIIRKSQRILIPYLIWSIFYIIVFRQQYEFVSLIKIFVLGRAAGHLYYCILYFFFILITPLIVKKMENKQWNIVFYLIMPVWFIVIYYLQLKYQISYAKWGIIPFTWFLYFYAGLKWRNILLKINIFTIVALICLGYFIESVETYFLFSKTGDSYFSVTPIRFSAILYVIPIILLFLKLNESQSVKNEVNKVTKVLISLGNNSFGIYLFHLVILATVRFLFKKTMPVINDTYMTYIFFHIIIVLSITLLVTNILINICKKVMPTKILKWIGFI
jgi:surface polysaccharide O-acyltransferase-like enzyme